MPSGIAEAVRKQVAQADKTGLVLERSPYSSTGFTNVIKVKNKYQARLQMKATAERKRYQHPLPGLFDTAEEAAEYLAIVKRDFGPDGVEPPPRQNQPSKPRSKPAKAQPVTMPQVIETATSVTDVPRAMASPIPFAMMHAPLVAVTPLPVQPCYVPPTAGLLQ